MALNWYFWAIFEFNFDDFVHSDKRIVLDHWEGLTQTQLVEVNQIFRQGDQVNFYCFHLAQLKTERYYSWFRLLWYIKNCWNRQQFIIVSVDDHIEKELPNMASCDGHDITLCLWLLISFIVDHINNRHFLNLRVLVLHSYSAVFSAN